MKTRIILAMALLIGHQQAFAGGSCSARDNTQYCNCAYDKHCVSTESACQCLAYGVSPPISRPREIVRPLAPPPTPQAIAPPKPEPSPEPVPHVAETPRDCVQQAEAAVSKGDAQNAFALIEKASNILLDRSIVEEKFDAESYEPIKRLMAAKKLLSVKDYKGTMQALALSLEVIQ